MFSRIAHSLSRDQLPESGEGGAFLTHSSPHCQQEHTSLDACPVAAPVNTRERRTRRIRTKLNALVKGPGNQTIGTMP